ncbi:MAG: hypothetical protein O3B04_09135 [Chloroflexi bacterium]|nr:hypothetical protein [Chloroflexota bacterium]
MSEVKDEAPLRVLFPQYWKLDSMVRGEVSGLSDEALDWTSDQYGWSGWSIRQQTSHLASLVYRWLLVRWRDQLFSDGIPVSDEELARLNSAGHDRRLDEGDFWELEQILGAVDGAMSLAQSVLRRVSVADGRRMVVSRAASPQWELMTKAHPNGVSVDASGGGTLSLEATFRHMYFEYMTHMFNMHRIKRALGLPVIVQLPDEGYHTVPGWDVSEA